MAPRATSRGSCPAIPMGGSERSGPEHASASVVDGIVWAITPHDASDPAAVDDARGTGSPRLGARPVRLDPERHDRLVAFVSHLPQVASTALMSLAATEEADEPEILLLAAGGFRDLTRLAASNPCAVERHPAREPGSDRRGDRSLRRALAPAARRDRRGARRRRGGDVRRGQAGASAPGDEADGAGGGRRCCRSRCPTAPARSRI